MLTVACVLRSGGDFTPEYVRKLKEGVTQHLHTPHRFICLSDIEVPCSRIPLRHNWPGWWSKLEVMSLPDTLGDVLYFDLDTIIIGDISDIASVNQLTTLTDFNQPKHLASGVMYLQPRWREFIWRQWIIDPWLYRKLCLDGGDQKFFKMVLAHRPVKFFKDLCPGQIVSYKRDVLRHGVPAGARAVCFHGKPRPSDIDWSLEPRPLDIVADSWAPEVSIKCQI